MSIHAVRLYYYYCKAVVANLAVFPSCVAGSNTADLTTEIGSCVANAVVSDIGGTHTIIFSSYASTKIT